MLHVDIPTLPEFKSLTMERSDACVSIYLETAPLILAAAEPRALLFQPVNG